MWIVRKFLGFASHSFSSREKSILKRAVEFARIHRRLAVVLLSTSIVIAFLDISSIAIISLGLTYLVNGNEIIHSVLPEYYANETIEALSSFSEVTAFILFVVVAVVLQIIVSSLNYYSARTKINLSAALNLYVAKLTSKVILGAKYELISTYPSGKLITLFAQSRSYPRLVVTGVDAVVMLILLLVYASFLMYVMPIMFFVMCIFGAIVWVGINKLSTIIKRKTTEAVGHEIESGKWSVEYFGAPKLVRMFNATEHAINKVVDYREKAINANQAASIARAAFVPAVQVLVILLVVSFLLLGVAILGDEFGDSAVKWVIFVAIAVRMKGHILKLNEVRLNFVRLLPILVPVEELLSGSEKYVARRAAKISLVPMQFTSNIQFNRVNFSYPDGTKALEGINVVIEKGTTTAFVGASGAGKSTVVDLILALYAPTKGEVLVDGVELRAIQLTAWRSLIGIVDQDIFLLNASVKENIAFGREGVTQNEIKDAATAAYADLFIEGLEHGYDTLIGDRGYKLSGGQRQRIGLARAFLRKPELLILDEATSSLDSETESFIQKTLREMHKKVTIVIIAHRLSTIANADKVVVLNNGIIVEEGGFDELRQRDGHFQRMWNAQIRDK